MASIIKVDTIQTAAGGDFYGKGSIINTYTDTTVSVELSSSTSFVASTLSIDVTPVSADSKFFLQLAGGGPFINVTGESLFVTFYRDSTEVTGNGNGLGRFYQGNAGISISPYSIDFLDSPNTTSQITYAVYYRSGGGGQVQFTNSDRGVLQFNIFEIAG